MENKDKFICSKCKTGMIDFSLDRQSDMCTYIACLQDGKCCMFEPLSESNNLVQEAK